MLRPLMWLAIVGFAASLMVHGFSILGQPNPLGPWAWGLHAGIFVVWFPAVLVAQQLSRDTKRADFWKAVLRGCPSWVRTGAGALVGYAVLNFLLFLRIAPPHTDIQDFRGFSGHWLVFYYIAAAILYSASHLGLTGPRTCPYGHQVSPFSKFCDQCGAPLPPLPI
ncbi:MAG TPA: zinc ribbon domain-containing protein [Isosphaeraceae bacterium]|nr:zinc ribbon domain-containing protein [Isosphaeraceae bacterium]